jgi:hypothetical protein
MPSALKYWIGFSRRNIGLISSYLLNKVYWKLASDKKYKETKQILKKR